MFQQHWSPQENLHKECTFDLPHEAASLRDHESLNGFTSKLASRLVNDFSADNFLLTKHLTPVHLTHVCYRNNMRLFRSRNSWEALGAFLHLGDALAAETLCLAGFEVKMKGWDGHGFWSVITNRAIWAL